jgi:hypothetical protein
MATRTRIQPLSQTLDIMVRDTLSPAARSRAVAAFAREKLREAQETNRRTLKREPAYRQYVDGSEGRPLEQVNPDGGRITFTFDVVADVTSFILAELERISPVDSGDFRRSHMAFADGREVKAGEAMPQAEEFVFLSPLPYSRAIELGRMRMRVAGTDRVYQQVARLAAARFGNLAAVKFTFRDAVGLAGGKRADRVPAITVRMR